MNVVANTFTGFSSNLLFSSNADSYCYPYGLIFRSNLPVTPPHIGLPGTAAPWLPLWPYIPHYGQGHLPHRESHRKEAQGEQRRRLVDRALGEECVMAFRLGSEAYPNVP